MNTASNCRGFESSPAATCAAEKLLKFAPLIIGQGQADKPSLEGRPMLLREEIIRRSMELLEQRKNQHVLISELVTKAKVSERTLRNAFNEYFGVSPCRYLQLRQLHQVYLALRTADPEEVLVSDVLFQYGVWDCGRFASRYRRLFGKPPSETLRETSM
jgi:AraC family ethanolamine operon transcriptional activator